MRISSMSPCTLLPCAVCAYEPNDQLSTPGSVIGFADALEQTLAALKYVSTEPAASYEKATWFQLSYWSAPWPCVP